MLNNDDCIVLTSFERTLKCQDKPAVWQTYTRQLLANAHTFGQTFTLFKTVLRMVILQTYTLAMLLQKNKCHLMIAVVNRLDNT